MIKIKNLVGNNSEAIKLWSPFIEKYSKTLSIFKDTFALMCDSMKTNNIGFIAESINLSSKLNLEGKNIQVTYSPTFLYLEDASNNSCKKYLNGKVESYQVRVKNFSEHFVNEDEVYENMLIESAAELINCKLNSYDSIVIYRLIESISNVEFEDGPYHTLKFRVAFFDEIKVESE